MDILLSLNEDCLKKESYCRSFIESTFDEYNNLLFNEEVDKLISESGGDFDGPPPRTLASEGLLIKVVNAVKKIIFMTIEYVKDVIERINTYFTGLKVNRISEKIKKISAEDKDFANTKITIPDYTKGVKRFDDLFNKTETLFGKAIRANGVLSSGDIDILEQIKAETDVVEINSAKYSKVVTLITVVATLTAMYAILKDVPADLAKTANEIHKLALMNNPKPLADTAAIMAAIRRNEARFLHNIIKKIYDEVTYIITGYGDISRPKGMTPKNFVTNNRKYYPKDGAAKAFKSYESVMIGEPFVEEEINVFEEAYNSILDSIE